ncbi:hypothetical protein [Goodfellowiella coeruleoviolacea]|uniref:Uncharacterized protein n=1 Tax=Goodfellowiella coeruleoviolacea TaxID=334858 RepID=A0AAE3GF65_9PSEU|nr:hypothetical protein [Goodfellowiella coeruleoviolacea]MCP2167086.1 hypothetical protein [Goodfellowiella coeruleoviolacea]
MVAAFGRLADGIDVGGINFPITTEALREAAKADVLPTAAAARICGEVVRTTAGRPGVTRWLSSRPGGITW